MKYGDICPKCGQAVWIVPSQHNCDHDEAYCAKFQGTKFCNCFTDHKRWFVYNAGPRWYIRQGGYISDCKRDRRGPFKTKRAAQAEADELNKPLDELEAEHQRRLDKDHDNYIKALLLGRQAGKRYRLALLQLAQ